MIYSLADRGSGAQKTKAQQKAADKPKTAGKAKGAGKAKEAENAENAHVEAINKELARTGVALDAVLERYGVSSIAEMSEATYKNAINSLKKTKSAA